VLFKWEWAMGMLKGHDSSRRTTLHADEISRQHRLPDLQPADSVRLHAAQWSDLLQHRSGQRAIRLERRRRRCAD
jgi:hypothetical protein